MVLIKRESDSSSVELCSLPPIGPHANINANINYLVVCLNTLVYLICLFCDYVGTNPIYRRYMEISFNYLVYFVG